MARPKDTPPLGESIGEIIDRVTVIVHEEVELAKAEVQIALQDLMRGSVAGIVGGVFAFFGVFILLMAFSFLLADAIGAWYPWLGFFLVAFFCFMIGGALAFVALKKIKKGSQLAPTQAIDEAKQTRSALQVSADDEPETIESVAVEEQDSDAIAVPAAEAKKPVVVAEVVEEPEAPAKPEEPEAPVVEADETAEPDEKAERRRAKQEAKAEKQAAKERAKAEKQAAKERAKAEKQAAKEADDEPAEPTSPQDYVPPQPPTPPSGPTGGE